MGCGYGFFLEELQKQGYDTKGVKTSIPACGYASRQLDLDVCRGRLEELDLSNESFEIVVSFDTLDYLVDPASELAQIKKVLRRGGVPGSTCIEQDSLGSPVAKDF